MTAPLAPVPIFLGVSVFLMIAVLIAYYIELYLLVLIFAAFRVGFILVHCITLNKNIKGS